MGNVVFGDRDTSLFLSMIARVIRILERKQRKKLRQDPHLFLDALEATKIIWLLQLAEIEQASAAGVGIDEFIDQMIYQPDTDEDDEERSAA